MEIVDGFIIAIVSLCYFFTIFIITLQLIFSKRFLKHPGNLFFHSCIYLFLYSLRTIPILLKKDGEYYNEPCKISGTLIGFAFFMQYNYIAFLSIEIIIKLKNNSNQKYSMRTKIYHIYCFTFSLSFAIIILLLGRYEKNEADMCVIETYSIGEYATISYTSFLMLIMWYSIFLSFQKMRQNKKSMIWSFNIVVVCLTIEWVICLLLPFIIVRTSIDKPSYIKFNLIISSFFDCIFCLSRLTNGKFKQDLKEKYNMYKLKKKGITPKENMQPCQLHKFISEFIDEEYRLSVVVSDFSGDMFDSLTQKVLFI
jgi:hypothetical protein